MRPNGAQWDRTAGQGRPLAAHRRTVRHWYAAHGARGRRPLAMGCAQCHADMHVHAVLKLKDKVSRRVSPFVLVYSLMTTKTAPN